MYERIIIECIGNNSIHLRPSAQPSGVAVYVTTVHLYLVKLKSDQLTPSATLEFNSTAAWPMGRQAHVSQLVRGCFYHLHRIKPSANSFRAQLPSSWSTALIVSSVDNCNSILASLPTCQLDRIQSVLNSAARLVYGRTPSDHTCITGLMRDYLHWLCVPQRIV